MGRSLWIFVGLGALYLTLTPGLRAAPPEPTGGDRDVFVTADRIDRWIAARLQDREIKPAPLTDDAEFLRRVYLDLAGKIPSIIEVRDFLDDPAPDKRRQLVERLLGSEQYVGHFTSYWRTQLMSQTNAQRGAGLDRWLRKQIKNNVAYDQWVRDILTTAPSGPGGEDNPSAFYQANEFKPENLAANTSRLFLGIKLECAQCHDHPFAAWSRSQFWEYAAFFAGLQPGRRGGGARGPLTIPGTDKVVEARFLDGSQPQAKPDADLRASLAAWTTTADNPYFARAVVNRMWAYFFGIGLIEPVDEPGETNPPSHPELLEQLAHDFAAHKFDLKFLIRAITASQAYQRTSSVTDGSQDDARSFARMAVRGLTPEQLFDSLAEATGHQEFTGTTTQFGQQGSARNDFLSRFVNPDKPTETQTSILQALYLMNGKVVAEATNLDRSRTLETIVTANKVTTARRVQELYMITLSRKPRPEETARLVKYVDAGGVSGDPRKAITDVFWALLNSAEFYLNH